MKIELRIQLDMKDLLDGMSDDEISQLLFDEYTHYVHQCHSKDALEWLCKSLKKPDDIGAKEIYLMHKTWSQLTNHPKVTIRVP